MIKVSPDEADGASATFAPWPWVPEGVPVSRGRGVIATTDEAASGVGAAVLAVGGSAVDAAIAAAFALAVVNPEAGGIGGSGYLLFREATGEAYALDFRSTAPMESDLTLFEQALNRDNASTRIGHLATAVPGVVAGLGEFHRRFGTRPWEDLVAPAIELARGFRVRKRLLQSFTPSVIEKLGRYPASAAIFLPGGSPPKLGEPFPQAALAETLERIRDHGAEEFYRAETAQRIVSASRRGGGILSAADLGEYRALWKNPIRVPYRGVTLLSTPPSSSGGVVLALLAGILEHFDLSPGGLSESERIHLLAEACRRAFVDRNGYLGDPEFVEIPLETLLDPVYARWRSESITGRASISSNIVPGVATFREGEHTTHLSVVDEVGRAVSLTLTLNSWYGSGVVAEETGVLLNCDMDDFTLALHTPNAYGLLQGEPNLLAPGRRMLSAMAPTMVLGPRQRENMDTSGKATEELRYVLGTPGGATIPTTTFQILSHLVDHGHSPAEAVAAPRYHHQHLPDQIEVEPGGILPASATALRSMGHYLYERDEYIGDVQLIVVEEDGMRAGYSDPRRGGRPAGTG